MKKIIISFGLIFSAIPVFASWNFLLKDAEGGTVETSKLTRTGQNVRVWVRHTFGKTHIAPGNLPTMSVVYYSEIDCKEMTETILSSTSYSDGFGEGHAVYKEPQTHEKLYMPPGTSAEFVANFACEKSS